MAVVTKTYEDKSWNGRPSKLQSYADRESLLQWILAQSKPLTIPEIAEMTGVDPKKLNVWLPWLWRNGKIGRIRADKMRKFFFGPPEVMEKVSVAELDLPETKKNVEDDFEPSLAGLKGTLGLMAAILVNARKVLIHPEDKAQRRRTLEWFTCGEDEEVFSFNSICEQLGLSRKKVILDIASTRKNGTIPD